MFPVTLHLIICTLVHMTSAEYDVTSQWGEISGKLSSYSVPGSTQDVIEYLGIPYAEPPTGENRFRPPVVKEAWNDTTLDATTYGAMCLQDLTATTAMMLAGETTYESFSFQDATTSEDCLYLNIYRPMSAYDNATSQSYATMVYIHGGDFTSGSGMFYGGTVLSALYDVIVVTLNYRLGAFGFLSDGTDELPGNYGILDQKMAVDWLYDNIAAFGGDPKSITIFGSGAGGSSVHLHTLMEDEVFAKAIVQSATYNDAMLTKETARGSYEELLAALGIDPDSDDVLEQLQAIDDDLVEAAAETVGSWQPVISDILPIPPSEEMKKGENNEGISVLVGSNSLDGYDYVSNDVDLSEPDWYNDTVYDVVRMTSEFYNWTDATVENRMLMFNSYYGGFEFHVDYFQPIVQNGFTAQMYTDQIYGSWAQEIAMVQSNVCDCNVYRYQFRRRPASDNNRPGWATNGAALGQELIYIFGFIIDPAEGTDPADVDLSYEMMNMWTGFAKTGRLPKNRTNDWDEFESYSEEEEGTCRSTVVIDAPGDRYTPDGTTTYQTLQNPRNWLFWEYYYAALGLSCTEDTGELLDDVTSEQIEECEPGVWSDAGVDMSNELAGDLLITFIVLTAFFMLCFLGACYDIRKKKKKIKKILGDDDSSSVTSNAMTNM